MEHPISGVTLDYEDVDTWWCFDCEDEDAEAYVKFDGFIRCTACRDSWKERTARCDDPMPMHWYTPNAVCDEECDKEMERMRGEWLNEPYFLQQIAPELEQARAELANWEAELH